MTARPLPRDLAVPCPCGAAVPLLLFVADGRPHSCAPCPACRRPLFLGQPLPARPRAR